MQENWEGLSQEDKSKYEKVLKRTLELMEEHVIETKRPCINWRELLEMAKKDDYLKEIIPKHFPREFYAYLKPFLWQPNQPREERCEIGLIRAGRARLFYLLKMIDMYKEIRENPEEAAARYLKR